MLFNSFIFWLFFIVVFALYRVLGHTAQNRLLLVASYAFYGFWDYRFLSLIFISTVVDYFAAQKIKTGDQGGKKIWLSVSIAFNLGMLGFFKYWNFFISEFAEMLAMIGINQSVPLLNIILPVGISFYTFQTMSYTIDVFRGRTEPTNQFLDFALYVSFFPQLVAGPIERSQHLLPQILLKRSVKGNDFNEGFYHVITGLFKKVVIADNMAPIVNAVFSRPVAELSGPEILIGIYAFAFQIYGDFSGYSSIAKGIAKWMGFDLMWNFKNPYFAYSPSDFWQRWHISLSSWLRDYLYIPLGGNRKGMTITLRNLVATMGLGGLWHGAGWTFMVWGLYHGFLLIVYRIYEAVFNVEQDNAVKTFNIKKLFKIVLFFHLICISWLFFRAESMSQVWEMSIKIVTDIRFTGFVWYGLATIVFYISPLMVLEVWTERTGNMLALLESHKFIRLLAYMYFIVMMIIFPPLVNQEFIYFQF